VIKFEWGGAVGDGHVWRSCALTKHHAMKAYGVLEV
jgi:hypothetical protein